MIIWWELTQACSQQRVDIPGRWFAGWQGSQQLVEAVPPCFALMPPHLLARHWPQAYARRFNAYEALDDLDRALGDAKKVWALA